MQSVSKLRHSIHTSLNHIIGYSEMLLEEFRPSESDGMSALEEIASSARRLSERIRVALAVSPQHSTRVEVYDEITSYAGRMRGTIHELIRAAPQFREDLQKIDMAASNLKTVAQELFSTPGEMYREDGPAPTT